MQEPKRGCGFRKVGAMYLVGSGMAVPCDALPLYIKACQRCGFKPFFTRGLQRVGGHWVAYLMKGHSCTCDIVRCPLCKLLEVQYGFMWVGAKYYTADSFIKEAQLLGVSKRIPEVPKWLKLHETWVLLAHRKVPVLEEGFNVAEVPAVFYAFRPQRVEVPIWESTATPEKLAEMEKRGLTPIIFKDGDRDHE